MDLKTPLYDVHVAEGGKIVPFAGWLLPVQYGAGIIAEHEAVRTAVGMFDVSHMGEFLFTGPTALDSLNHIITNDYSAMPAGKVRYGVLCTEDGGCIDDLIVYKFADDEWFVVNQLSQQIYCMDFVKNNFVATNYSFMPKDKYGKIDFIVSVQDEGNVFVFQKITPSYIYEKQKMLSWEHIISPTDQAVLSNHKNVLVIKEGGDCYYIKDTDKLYFRNLNAITSIFDGINILRRELMKYRERIGVQLVNDVVPFEKDVHLFALGLAAIHDTFPAVALKGNGQIRRGKSVGL